MEALLVFGLLLALYFLPAIFAHARGRANVAVVFIVNLVFGWTMLGWLIALVWAFSGETKRDREYRLGFRLPYREITP